MTPTCPRACVRFVPIADVNGVASPIGMYQTVFPFKALTPDTGLTVAKLFAAALYFASSALMADALAPEALALEALAVPLEAEPTLDELELAPLLEHAPTTKTTTAAPATPMSLLRPRR